MIKAIKNLTKFEKILWIFSLAAVLLPAFFCGKDGVFTSASSVVGVTALIFIAKGHVLGQILTVIFSIMYAAVSLSFCYYGEMITYLFMTAPMAAAAIVSWIKNPFEKGKSEVKIEKLKKGEPILLCFLAAAATLIFGYFLYIFKTPNIIFSTLSVTTSFVAAYLTFRRNRFYAIAYSANDAVLITLWVLASVKNTGYIPMIFCFAAFFINDIYGFVSWSRMKKRQSAATLQSR